MGIFWEEGNFWTFVFVSWILGGGAAFLSGRAVASTWKPYWHAAAYMVLLGGVVRFFHFALFGGTLLQPWYYLVDFTILIALSALGYRMMRTTQMVTQYRWLYKRTSPLSWMQREAKG